MNKIFLLSLLIFTYIQVGAQFLSEQGDTLYGDEWISFDQEYFKIPVAEDGMYRISYEELNAAGIPVASLAGENLQMFHNGEAYPIYVNNSSSLGAGDFVEFYGRKNRGELDEIFYEDPESMQLNPEYSLFTDTSAYFLTWNSEGGNLRVEEVQTVEGGNGLSAEQFYMHKERLVLSNRVQKPTRNGSDNVRYSHFDVGEGFGGNLNKKNEVALSASSIFAEGTAPSVDVRFTTNATAHEIDFSINGDKMTTWKHSAYALRQEHVDFSLSQLRATNKITLEGKVDNVDRNILSVVDLNYPREFDFDGEDYFEFFMEASSEVKLVELDDFDGGSTPMLYDPATGSRIAGVISGEKVEFTIPSSALDRNLIAFNSEESTKKILDLEEMDFVNYGEWDGEYIIISHPKLMTGNTNQVQEYADYRSSSAGGSFKSVVVNVEDLYEQFSYGVHRHSYSVKNFVNWAKKNWDNAQYVFIIGKGREYALYRTEAQITDPLNSDFTVPTFGYPGSDNLLVGRGSSTIHEIPTGRLAVRTTEQISGYLDKIVVMEDQDRWEQTVEGLAWKKQVLHLSGGDPAIQASLFSYLSRMENVIESNKIAANVETVRKFSSSIIDNSLNDLISDYIDSGLSLLTFFGHSAVGTFDFGIQDPILYENKDKYPLIISLGCYSGNIHTSSVGIGEEFVLLPSKGSIGFIASSSTAYVSSQGNTGEDFYEILGGEEYGEELGKTFNKVLARNAQKLSIQDRILNEQLTFHGDPALRLFSSNSPDLVVPEKSIEFLPGVVSTQLDSFTVSFDVVNLGEQTKDSFTVKIIHSDPAGELVREYTKKTTLEKYEKQITISLKDASFTLAGKNSIQIEIDSEMDIEERAAGAESNNTVSGVEFFILDNGVRGIYPEDLGILNASGNKVLMASTFNALIPKQSYIFQIDTTKTFASPVFQSFEVRANGGLIQAPLTDLNMQDETVYYWRVAINSGLDSLDLAQWDASSFVYLENGSYGWNQSHYYQFADNPPSTGGIDTFRQFTLAKRSQEYTFDIQKFNPVPNIINVNGNSWSSLNARNKGNGFIFHIREPHLRNGIFRNYNEFGGTPHHELVFFYKDFSKANTGHIRRLLDSIPPNSEILVFSIINDTIGYDTDEWDEDIYEIFDGLGSEFFSEYKNKGNVPYIGIFGLRSGRLQEQIGTDNSSILNGSYRSFSYEDDGIFDFQLIPVGDRNLSRLEWRERKQENDESSIQVLGVSSSSGENMDIATLDSQYELDLTSQSYDSLRIKFNTSDPVDKTSSQLSYLRVYYNELPDVVINSNLQDFQSVTDTVMQGESISFTLPLENVSSTNIDSSKLTLRIQDESNNVIVEEYFVKQILGREVVLLPISIQTTDLSGNLIVSVTYNNDRARVESNYFNNYAVFAVNVEGDERNPVLDIFFDGRPIFDDDIVSANPEIAIFLQDENPELALNEEAFVNVEITSDNFAKSYSTTDDEVTFVQGTLPKNEAELRIRPSLDDGFYTLKVDARDRTGNQVSNQPREISFQVINKSQVSEIYNYPNPFSTKTKFVFTLTGSEIPDEFSIKIFTTSGKLVKQIFREELGRLNIGSNITEYEWDGTDDYGQRLANGVYLYKVMIKSADGAEFEKFQRGNTAFQAEQMGKMMLLR